MKNQNTHFRRAVRKMFCALLWALAVLPARSSTPPVNPTETLSQQAHFDQNVGAQIPLDAVFRDETGAPIALRALLNSRPMILVLGYHECPMLCSVVLGGLVETLTQIRQTTGKDFDLVDVSISPTDPPAAAAKQRRIYFKRYARGGAEGGWHFLTTPDADKIRTLCDTVGFHYAYDPNTGQYAHPSGFVVLTPDGKISRYFFGVTYDAGEVQGALQTAAHRQLGTRIAELLLVCFHYNPLTGRYGRVILGCLRAGGIVTIAAMGGGIIYLVTRPPVPPPAEIT